ncbi:MAG TPA: hypothetical protein VN520_05125 [Streptomyces sp.]|uniref:hypothetical protein n=1 Tax=Streptomyces sp. TaxID=1931 RepID=UPI002CCA434F|nr:hypothetical protein [Streptomyces sp.]HWU05767.1 hypothetical protein [Streptomyces sp.]
MDLYDRPDYRAAVEALEPGSCPLLRPLDELRVRRSTTDPWEWVQIPEDSTAASALAMIMAQGVLHGDMRLMDLVDLASRRTVYHHLDPCPLCQHRADSGPRVFGVWATEPWVTADWSQGLRAPEPRGFLELASAGAAEEEARNVARLVAEHTSSIGGPARLRVFQVRVEEGRCPGWYPLLAQVGTELWLWHEQPPVAERLRRPDRVFRVGDEGRVSVHDSLGAVATRPSPIAWEPSPSPFHTSRAQDGRELAWFDDGGGGLLVSVLDPSRPEPAVRMSARGEEPVEGAPTGLILFGHGINTRPPLTELRQLAPRFADLAPAPSRLVR